jgi:2-oxo-4-hydroxy-4-carboxy--5-ureidoimidazoline (OHCU) decarboxylase
MQRRTALTQDQEIAEALAQIGLISRLRLFDAVGE